MKMFSMAAAAMLAVLCLAAPAEAQRSRGIGADLNWDTAYFGAERSPQARSQRSSRSARNTRASRSNDLASLSLGGGGYNAGPRPRQWCGWWMRTQLGGGAHLNLAWNWRNYGSPASPQVGAVVVWRHHVGMIVGQASNGKWLVKSGNWGGRVATAARSIGGAVVRI